MSRDTVVLAGYLVRCPLGGYAWQILHYLLGLRALGFDPYFYEDTAYYADCFDPLSGAMHVAPDTGVAFAGDFLGAFGFGERWMFWDAQRNHHHGRTADQAAAILNDARIVITLAAVNRLPRRSGQRKVFIDVDPALTQIRAYQGDQPMREFLADHDLHFTIGENIGTAACSIPTAGVRWRPTRQPIALELWPPLPPHPAAAFTTVGRWDESTRDVVLQGERFTWRKRVEWLKFLTLPRRTREPFALAMDVDKEPGDRELLERHGWQIFDPVQISRDALTYRDFIRRSKGEFTVAKDINIRLASGWFSDRGACYLAAARPVITQDTGFGRTLPIGKGLFAVRTIEEAVGAVETIVANYETHSQAARDIAAGYFDARRVLADLIAAT